MAMLANTNSAYAQVMGTNESTAELIARQNLATAELQAQRMRSQAIRNAHTERRYDPYDHKYHDYTPGNF